MCFLPFLSFKKIHNYIFVFCLNLIFMSHRSALPYYVCIVFILHVCHMGLILSDLSSLIIGKMSHHSSVAARELEPRDHWLVLVCLMWNCPLLEFRCLHFRLPRGNCHMLVPRKPQQSMLMNLLSMLSFMMSFFIFFKTLLWHFTTASVCKHVARNIWDGEVK